MPVFSSVKDDDHTNTYCIDLLRIKLVNTYNGLSIVANCFINKAFPHISFRYIIFKENLFRVLKSKVTGETPHHSTPIFLTGNHFPEVDVDPSYPYL